MIFFFYKLTFLDGDLVRERKMSRSEASDSSKDGSIQVRHF